MTPTATVRTTAIAAAVILLAGCSTHSADSPTANVEQTTAPAPTLSASPTAAPEFVVRTATEEDWSAYSDGYVFAEQPQGEGEQFIADTYPDLWAQGVRVLSPKLVPGYNYADPALPGAVIQYINGERYEGTISTPLGFRGQTASPESLPSDTVANTIAAINGRGAWPEGNSGQGGYTIDINEKDAKGTALAVYQFTNNSATKQIGSTMYFSNWEEAWAYAQTNGYSTPGMDRALNPGEVSSAVTLRKSSSNVSTGMSMWVYDSSIGDWALAVNYDK